jgi:hypothetical protein
MSVNRNVTVPVGNSGFEASAWVLEDIESVWVGATSWFAGTRFAR